MLQEGNDKPKYLRESDMKVHYGAEDLHNTSRDRIGKVWVVDVLFRTCNNFFRRSMDERMRAGRAYDVNGGLGYPTARLRREFGRRRRSASDTVATGKNREDTGDTTYVFRTPPNG